MLSDVVKKAFVLSPLRFARFQAGWHWYGFKYRHDSRRQVTARHSFLQTYRNDVVYGLKKKYRNYLPELKERIDREDAVLPHESSGKVWVCWLQGIEFAPDIVKICYQSILDHFPDREVVLVTEENYRNYVSFPPVIANKVGGGGAVRCVSLRLNPA